jgi:hypothetical protein
VIIVEAQYVNAANRILERHGYGPNNLSVPLILKRDADDHAPRGYGCLLPIDAGLKALIVKYIEGDTKARFLAFRAPRNRKLLKEKLDENNLRIKPRTEDQ